MKKKILFGSDAITKTEFDLLAAKIMVAFSYIANILFWKKTEQNLPIKMVKILRFRV